MHKEIKEFMCVSLKNGEIMQHFDGNFGVNIYGFNGNDFNNIDIYRDNQYSTSFGYIQNGKCKLYNNTLKCSYELTKGMYFSIPNNQEYIIKSLNSDSMGFLINQNEYNGMFNIGGPIENIGRLKYIDGCTDSLLISPIMYGDPCLNALYFIQDLLQTQHTHPSFRCGMITNGYGYCILENNQEIPLTPNDIFFIPKDTIHSFKTDKNERMTVIAFHPDSNFGPTHQIHPMINNTIVNNISASQLPEIQSK